MRGWGLVSCILPWLLHSLIWPCRSSALSAAATPAMAGPQGLGLSSSLGCTPPLVFYTACFLTSGELNGHFLAGAFPIILSATAPLLLHGCASPFTESCICKGSSRCGGYNTVQNRHCFYSHGSVGLMTSVCLAHPPSCSTVLGS